MRLTSKKPARGGMALPWKEPQRGLAQEESHRQADAGAWSRDGAFEEERAVREWSASNNSHLARSRAWTSLARRKSVCTLQKAFPCQEV